GDQREPEPGDALGARADEDHHAEPDRLDHSASFSDRTGRVRAGPRASYGPRVLRFTCRCRSARRVSPVLIEWCSSFVGREDEGVSMSQRHEWINAGAFPVAPGVHRIPLPLPTDGLRAVNVYAIEGEDGL